RALNEESLALRRELGDRRGIAASLAGLGDLIVATAKHMREETAGEQHSQLERAVRLFGAVDSLLESMICVLDIEDRQPYEQSTAEARAILGSTAFERAWTDGRRLDLEEAVLCALEG